MAGVKQRIPIDECENRRIYNITSRNLQVGVWVAASKGFIGIREKFGTLYLFEEYHYDADPHVGTVVRMEPLDAWVPEEIPLAEYLIDETGEWVRDSTGHLQENAALYDLLKVYDDLASEEWARQEMAAKAERASRAYRPQTREEHEREIRAKAATKWVREQMDAGVPWKEAQVGFHERLKAQPTGGTDA